MHHVFLICWRVYQFSANTESRLVVSVNVAVLGLLLLPYLQIHLTVNHAVHFLVLSTAFELTLVCFPGCTLFLCNQNFFGNRWQGRLCHCAPLNNVSESILRKAEILVSCASPLYHIPQDFLIQSSCRYTKLKKPSPFLILGCFLAHVSLSLELEQCQGRKQTDKQSTFKNFYLSRECKLFPCSI